jgi:hypothetical protein
MTWVAKLQIECIDEDNGGMTIRIEWDEQDPELAEWTSWGPKGQEEFIMSALRAACWDVLEEDLTDPVD